MAILFIPMYIGNTGALPFAQINRPVYPMHIGNTINHLKNVLEHTVYPYAYREYCSITSVFNLILGLSLCIEETLKMTTDFPVPMWLFLYKEIS